jgi:hypothetical protein
VYYELRILHSACASVADSRVIYRYILYICMCVCRNEMPGRLLGFVEFKVYTAVVMKVAVFWDIVPCSPYMNHRFVGTYHPIFRVEIQPNKKPAYCSSTLVSCLVYFRS